MVASLPLVAVYADESCLGNGREGENPGGAGVLVEYARPDGPLVRRDLWVAERATTNNRMALRSVIEACRALSRKGSTFRIVFTTDSRYIVDGMTKWVHDWARRGWRRKSGAIENLDLWREAVSAAASHEIAWRWVRGHNGHAQNEYANDLAVRAAETLCDSPGLVDSQFDEWLAKRDPPLKPDDFPATSEFRPSPGLPPAGERRH
ncbi:MAG: Ribonuclease HI [Gemmatimonadaceae bacterium]|nr:Ribonuclease HI [Gemmatimonadaceae bacterium]